MALDQFLPFVFDREEPGDEAIQVRRHCDEEVGLVLVAHRGRIRAGADEPPVQIGIGLIEPPDELAVEPFEARGIVEVPEGEAEGGGERGSGGHLGRK